MTTEYLLAQRKVALSPGSPSSASVCNMIFDLAAISTGSKEILRVLAEDLGGRAWG